MPSLQNVLPTLVIGFYDNEDLRILKLEDELVVFQSAVLMPDTFNLILAVFDLKSYAYVEFEIRDCKIVKMEDKTFSYIYHAAMGSFSAKTKEQYNLLINELSKTVDASQQANTGADYLDFIKGRQPLYPKELDKVFFDTYEAQEWDWYNIEIPEADNRMYTDITVGVETAFSLNNMLLYKQAASIGLRETFAQNLQRLHLAGHGIFAKPFSRVYIGNEFCQNLFPKPDQLLFELLEKALQENISVTISLPFLREDTIDSTLALLNVLQQWVPQNQAMEVLCNDWGLLEPLGRDFQGLTPVLGRLLNKRYKDPKFVWKWGYEKVKNRLKENYLNSGHFLNFLNARGVLRFEFEAHGQGNCIPEGNHSLHFPYYQMNTSQYCPTHAECTSFSRTKQKAVNNCPMYCSEFFSLYPKHLQMIGRGNSIFGFYKNIFLDPRELNNYIAQGIDRLVFDI